MYMCNQSNDSNHTAVKATKVVALLIAECYAKFECKLINTRLIKRLLALTITTPTETSYAP
jgi:flavin reductase (DIM6/NTAB) family NADH-FMN oxidoreductase RutF